MLASGTFLQLIYLTFNCTYLLTPFVTGLQGLRGLAFDSSGNLFAAQNVAASGEISKITPAGVVTPFVTGISNSSFLTFDSSGNLFATDAAVGKISKITPAGVITTFATGVSGGLAFDSSGNLFTADSAPTGQIKKITPAGQGNRTCFLTISTI